MQVVCELALSLACLRGIARSCRQSTLVLESLAAGSTCHRERPSHWLPASRLRSWSPSKQLGSVPREFPTRDPIAGVTLGSPGQLFRNSIC